MLLAICAGPAVDHAIAPQRSISGLRRAGRRLSAVHPCLYCQVGPSLALALLWSAVQDAMKACVRFLWLAMAAGACAAARLPSAATSSPGSDQGSSPTAAQLAEAVLDPSIPPEQAIDAVLSAGRVVEVNSSLDLWQALQEQQEGVLSVVLQGEGCEAVSCRRS